MARARRYGAHGLAVYHMDDAVLTRNYWRCSEAENWKEFRSEGWRKAWTGETHYAISLIQADDRWNLEHATNVADSGDLYPGSSGATSLTSSIKPNTSNYYFWAGSAPKFGYSGATITKIRESAGTVTASLSFVPWVAPRNQDASLHYPFFFLFSSVRQNVAVEEDLESSIKRARKIYCKDLSTGTSARFSFRAS